MDTIKDLEGNILYKGDEFTLDEIKNLFIEAQIMLDEEGNLDKCDIDQLLKDCINEVIN